MNETEILRRIDELVAEEHRLRQGVQDGTITTEAEHDRLRQLEEALDQSWDLLRQRRAKREMGENPDSATARPVSEVERYLQ